ncbi:hypothetical protein TorRG33x02_264110, partial [Trema orientale]
SMSKSNQAESSKLGSGRKRNFSTAISVEREKAPNRLIVDEAIGDDNAVASLPPDTMGKLHLSYGDPVLIKGKRSRQAVSIAIAYDDTCCDDDDEPKIRLSKSVMNDLRVRIGDVVSVHRCGNRERILPTDDTTEGNNRLSKFLNNVHDELLYEIFVRFPDCRSAVQYSSVCKRWSSIISNSAFVQDFIHIHDHCQPFSDDYYSLRPFTILFRRHNLYFDNDDEHESQYFDPFCQVFSEKSKILHGKMPSNYFNFLPCPVAMLASFDDLVVVTSIEHAPISGATDNYICNPLTKQWLALPKVSLPSRIRGYGLVREPTICNKQLGCTTNARYRVVLIGRAISRSDLVRGRYNEFVAVVFCSEIGQWSESIISLRHWGIESNLDIKVVASNGVLYWLEGYPLKGIVAFDPFNDIHTKQCRFINLPVVCFKNTQRSTEGKVCLGVVKGQLRLSQLSKVQSYFVFKVWELKNWEGESPSWDLVYNLKLNSSERKMFVLSFHPNNTNVVFLLCGNNVCRYEISEKKYEKVGKYPDELEIDPEADSLSLTLIHPSWPTQIAELPSS